MTYDDDAATPAELYCTRPGSSYAFGRGQALLADSTSGALVALPEPVARTLEQTRAFATLGAHARKAGRRMAAMPGSESRMAELLAELARDGLLTSLAELGEPTRDVPAQPIEAVCVLTCDRPVELERCVISIVQNLRDHGHRREVVVFDDTRTPDGERRTRELLGSLSARLDFPLRHAGRVRKAAFAERLASAAGVPERVADFALTGRGVEGETIGANRNAVLLDNVGRALLSVDDDTVFRGVLPPNERSGLRILDGRDPTELWFFDSRSELCAAFADVDLDVISEHERVLGRTVANVLATTPGSTTIDDPTPVLASELASERARVVVSVSGVVGDSGHHSGTALLTHDAGGTRSRLLASAESYASALSSREVLRSVDRVTLGLTPALATTVVGLDNSRLLPPFSPGHRNEDGLFGLLTRLTVLGGYWGFVPAALWHLPPARRFARDAHLEAADGVRLSELLIALLLECPLRSLEARPERRLRRVAAHFSEIGGLPPDDFAEVARHAVRELAARRASLLDSQLQARRGPDFWARDVQSYLVRSKQALADPDCWLPRDLDAAHGERARHTRRYVRRFGELCAMWPKLRRAAIELGERGERLSELVSARS